MSCGYHHHNHHHHCRCADDGVERMNPFVRVYSKANEHYSLSIRHGHVVLAPTNTCDDSQLWVKVDKYSNSVRDQTGLPSFALVNKATGLAIRHSFGSQQPVQVTEYDHHNFDQTVLWSEKHIGGGFYCIRMINNIRLNFDALNGNPGNGGSIYDGTPLVLWEWLHGDNQLWRIVPSYTD